MNLTQTSSSSTDFDFFMGDWAISHLRLKERMVNCQEWETFSGSSKAHKILNGEGNIDDNVLHMQNETYHALTIRTFNPETKMWSIWWLDGRHPDQLDVPVRGSFVNNIGTFYADEILNGMPIRVRFQWDANKPESPRWEQAFSSDGGVNWETNWMMDFTKTA